MTGNRRRGRVLLPAAFVAAMVFVANLSVPVWADVSAAQVELDCRITSTSRRLNQWVVELRRASGEPARIVSGLGETNIRIRNLQPGIYMVCIIGTENRQSCQSVDLIPPGGKTFFRFKKRFAAPKRPLHSGDLNKVSQVRLAVPAKARTELYRAEQAQLRGDYEQEAQHLRQAIEIDPSYADALNNLGTYYHREGKFDKSIECFATVTRLDPDFYGGWVNLAGSLLAMGQFQQALVANKHAYDLRPNDGGVISQIALNYFYLHDMPEAKKYFLRVLAMDPASASEPQLYLVHIALAEQNKEEAALYIKNFLSIHPNAPEADHMKRTLASLDSISFHVPTHYEQTK